MRPSFQTTVNFLQSRQMAWNAHHCYMAWKQERMFLLCKLESSSPQQDLAKAETISVCDSHDVRKQFARLKARGPHTYVTKAPEINGDLVLL
jgi:hypothetical protein